MEIVQTTDASAVEQQDLRKRSTMPMEAGGQVVAVVSHDVRIHAPQLHDAIAEAWLSAGAPIPEGWKVTDGWASSPGSLR
jgi:hypothetical protein